MQRTGSRWSKNPSWYDFRPSGEWRNWQTRRTQNPVSIALVGVRLPPRPPVTYGPKVRRQRRRRSFIVYGVLGILLAIAIGVTRAAGETELTRAYLDLAFDIARTEDETAQSFSSMIIDIEDFNRASMVDRLERLEADTAELVDRLDEADPPGALEEAHLFLRIATTTWRSALSDARVGLIALADDPLDEEGLDVLGRGLVDLRVGDSAYAGFLSEIAAIDTTLQGDPPVVAFVPVEQDALFEPQELARRLFLAPSLGPVSNVAVADLRLEPGSVGEQEGLPVLAITDEQKAEVTISNRGNLPAANIGVLLSLISNDGELWEARQEIPLLEGGELTTLVFSDLPVEPGTIYEVIVTSLFDDDDNDDDTFSMLFLVNAEG